MDPWKSQRNIYVLKKGSNKCWRSWKNAVELDPKHESYIVSEKVTIFFTRLVLPFVGSWAQPGCRAPASLYLFYAWCICHWVIGGDQTQGAIWETLGAKSGTPGAILGTHVAAAGTLGATADTWEIMPKTRGAKSNTRDLGSNVGDLGSLTEDLGSNTGNSGSHTEDSEIHWIKLWKPKLGLMQP